MSGDGRQRARHRHALAHAAGELGRALVHGGREVHHLDVVLDARRRSAFGAFREHLVDRSATFSRTVSHGISE